MVASGEGTAIRKIAEAREALEKKEIETVKENLKTAWENLGIVLTKDMNKDVVNWREVWEIQEQLAEIHAMMTSDQVGDLSGPVTTVQNRLSEIAGKAEAAIEAYVLDQPYKTSYRLREMEEFVAKWKRLKIN